MTDDGPPDAAPKKAALLRSAEWRNLRLQLWEADAGAEWHAAVAAIVAHLLNQLQSAECARAGGDCLACEGFYLGGEADDLRELIAEGPRKRMGRPLSKKQLHEDMQRVSGPANFACMAAWLALQDGIPKDRARKRLEAAEKASGRKLKRSAPFGKK